MKRLGGACSLFKIRKKIRLGLDLWSLSCNWVNRQIFVNAVYNLMEEVQCQDIDCVQFNKFLECLFCVREFSEERGPDIELNRVFPRDSSVSTRRNQYDISTYSYMEVSIIYYRKLYEVAI